MELDRYIGNPILMPNNQNHWESLAVCNPGACIYNDEVYLLYRAAGNDAEHIIRIGLAKSKDGYNFIRVSNQPLLSPSKDGFDSGCIEDPRVSKIDEFFYITYATRPFPPGQYWLKDNNNLGKNFAINHSISLMKNLTSSGLIVTKDFKTFKRLGRITKATIDDRDVILFPEKIRNKFVMLHRPIEWVGPNYNTDVPAIWIAFSNDILSWGEDYLLIKSKYEWERKKIGANTPPIKTEKGWLLFYHGVDKEGIYRVGVLLLDIEDPKKVIRRSKKWVLEPREEYEVNGIYNNCVFPCGSVVIGEKLFVYYGSADKYCCLATCNINDLLDWLILEGDNG